MIKMVHSINPGVPLTDLKMRQCRGCDNLIVFEFGAQKFMPIYCETCHKKYNEVLGGYDN